MYVYIRSSACISTAVLHHLTVYTINLNCTVHMDEEEELEKKVDIKVYEDFLSQAFADSLKYNKAVQLLHPDLLLSDKESCLEEGQIKNPRERAHLLLKALHVEEKPNALIQFLKSDEELKSLAEDIHAQVIKPGPIIALKWCVDPVPCASLIISKYTHYTMYIFAHVRMSNNYAHNFIHTFSTYMSIMGMSFRYV